MLKDPQNRKYINVISLDSYLRIFDKWNIYILTATVFQVGSATVYLFFKFPFWETLLIQMLVPAYKFTQQACHKFFTTWWLPYWLTTILLRTYMK